MSNTFTTLLPTIIARGLPVLRKYCVMSRLINTDYSTEAAMRGNAVNIPIPSSLSASSVSASNTPVSPSNLAPTSVAISLNQWNHVAFGLTDKEMTEILADENALPMAMEEAFRALAELVNSDILATYTSVYGFTGTAGTTPFATDVTAATNSRKVLANQKCPLDNRRMVLNPDAEANALALAAFSNFQQTGDQRVIIDGLLGRKFGYDIFVDQQIPTHTTGTLSNGSTHTAKVNGTFTVGSTSIDLNETALTGTIVTGDIFTIAGDTTTYVVTNGTLTAAGNAVAGVQFQPPLVVQPSSGAVVTFKATHVVNLAFNRNAFAFAARPLADAVGMMIEPNRQVVMRDPLTGIPLRIEYVRENKQTVLDIDILYGVKCIRPELATRIAG